MCFLAFSHQYSHWLLFLHASAEVRGKNMPKKKWPQQIFERTIAFFFFAVSEKNFKEFLYVHIVQVAPFTSVIFIVKSKFHEQFLKKVTQGTFLGNYFKIWPAVSEKILGIPFILIVQVATIHQRNVYKQIKISQTIFRKGSSKGYSCKIISKLDQQFQRSRFLKKCLKISFGCHGRVFDGIKFCSQFLKRTSQGTLLSSLVQTDPVVWEEMFKEIVEEARQTQDHPKSSPWVCCAQVS